MWAIHETPETWETKQGLVINKNSWSQSHNFCQRHESKWILMNSNLEFHSSFFPFCISKERMRWKLNLYYFTPTSLAIDKRYVRLTRTWHASIVKYILTAKKKTPLHLKNLTPVSHLWWWQWWFWARTFSVSRPIQLTPILKPSPIM